VVASLFSQQQYRTSGLLTILDFKNGEYYADGASRSLADMTRVVNNGYWTTAYALNPVDVVAGVGWTSSSATASYALLSTLALAGWWDGVTHAFSAVMKTTTTTDGTNGKVAVPRFTMSPLTAGLPAYQTDIRYGKTGGGAADESVHYLYNNSTDGLRQDTDTYPDSPQRTGYTVNGALQSGCVNGGTVLTEAITATQQALNASINGPFLVARNGTGYNATIEEIRFYAPMTDAQLQALTA